MKNLIEKFKALKTPIKVLIVVGFVAIPFLIYKLVKKGKKSKNY